MYPSDLSYAECARLRSYLSSWPERGWTYVST
jgi:hypothetical protein